jgi:Domain of unknown function (DUF4375)
LSVDLFNPNYVNLYDILKALELNKVDIPSDMLLELLTSIKGRATEYPFEFIYAHGLRLLAQANGSGVANLIEEAKQIGSKRIREVAAEADVLIAGVSDAYGVVYDSYQINGVKGLSLPQLQYLTICWLDTEVNNGGFSQFFFNTSGELAIYAAKAAVAVGSKEKSKVIEKAIALFGHNGPNVEREARMKQLSMLNHKVLSELDTAYYKANESISELLSNFVVAHTDDFRKAPDA